MLPDGEGQEVLCKIRDDRLGSRVAVCTAMSDPSRLAVVEGMAPTALLRKPIKTAELCRVFEVPMPE